ncbi:MAG: group 1 glycosyl transferase, partial [Calditrichaeota bacterium]
MKKVLILTYYWPPAGGPGVQRVVRFVRYLPEFGWQPIVLTVKDGDYPARDESLQEKIPPQCRVYRSPIPEPYRLYRKFTGKALDEPLPKSILSEAANSSLKDRLARWIRVNLFIPDARVGWLLTGGKVGRRIL